MEADAIITAASYLSTLDYVSKEHNNHQLAAERDELVLPLYDKPDIVLFPNGALSFRLPIEWWGYMKMDMWAPSSSSKFIPCAASPPGCFVVFPSVQTYPNPNNTFISDIGCIAHVLGASRDREAVSGVAIGRYVCRRVEMVSSKTARVIVLNDGCHHNNSTNHIGIPRLIRGENYCFTSIPQFVFGFTSPIGLSKQIFSTLRSRKTWEGLRPAPALNWQSETARNPVKLSYWLASSLPIPFEKRADLLATLSLRERLWKEVTILNSTQSESSFLYCIRCGLTLAEKPSLFQVGNLGLHVNPYGYIHDIGTFHDVCDGCTLLVGAQSTEDTWFPGYAWQIVDCRVCSLHIGWHFTLSLQSSNTGMMQQFWGLRKAAITDEPHNSILGFATMERQQDRRVLDLDSGDQRAANIIHEFLNSP